MTVMEGKSTIDSVRNRENATKILEELKSFSPDITKQMIDDRCEYINNYLLENKGETIVAIVGFGFMDGIEKLWKSY